MNSLTESPPQLQLYIIATLTFVILLGLLWFNTELSNVVFVSSILAVLSNITILILVAIAVNQKPLMWCFLLATLIGSISVIVLVYYDIAIYEDATAALIKGTLLYCYYELVKYARHYNSD